MEKRTDSFPKDLGEIPVLKWKLSTICNCLEGFQRSIWTPQALHIGGAQTYPQASIHTHEIKIIKKSQPPTTNLRPGF